MDTQLTLPLPDEIDRRIRDCREELIALKKLRKLAKTAQQAEDARERRTGAAGKGAEHAVNANAADLDPGGVCKT